MNMFDARIEHKYARIRVNRGDDYVGIGVTLPEVDLTFDFHGDQYDASKDSLVYLLENSGYKIIWV